jgi:hypothetical protein
MFFATWTTPAPLAGTLRFRVDPRRRGLGIYEDVDGVRWDINMISGQYVAARKVAAHPDYYGTGGNCGLVGSTQGVDLFHKWEPYAVEVVE